MTTYTVTRVPPQGFAASKKLVVAAVKHAVGDKRLRVTPADFAWAEKAIRR